MANMSRLYRRFIAVFVLIVVGFSALAGVEPYQNQLKGRIKKGDTLLVRDEKFRSKAFDWATITNRSVKNMITFQLTYDTPVVFKKAFSCEVDLKIEYYARPDQAEPITVNDVKLKINYKPDSGATYRIRDVYNFSNGYWVKITVNNITSAELGDSIPPVLQLTSQVIVDRKYRYEADKPLQMSASFSGSMIGETNTGEAAAVNTSAQRLSSGTSSQYYLNLAWDPINGATEYDLEWTALESSPEHDPLFLQLMTNQPVSDEQINKLFRNNATRVTTDALLYDISMVYNAKYLLVRIRGVEYPDGQYRTEYPWNYKVGANPANAVYAIWDISGYEHHAGLNWQYGSVFAEEGKKKEIVSYFDGTLRNRQTVTVNNMDHVAIVQESVYDEFGRPAASILPAPHSDSKLKYYGNFNIADNNGAGYNYTHLRKALGEFCEYQPEKLKNTIGASHYYSPANALQVSDDHKKYIPDAEGYPLSVTQYVNDNTGRIRTQGGVGKAFQPGLTDRHVTKYYYGKPEPWELDRLFGSDVGFANRYLKNMMVDPNGQISISYVNASGKTIATALAGEAPKNVASLASKLEPQTETSHVLLPKQFTFDASALTISANSTFLVSVPNQVAAFSYDFQKLIYAYQGNAFQICSNCYYDLDISVTNDCGQPVYQSLNTVIGSDISNCNNTGLQNGNFNVTFGAIGEYYIHFVLKLNKNVIEKFATDYIAGRQQHGTLDTEFDFVSRYLELANLDDCFNDCSTCELALGTKQQFGAIVKSKLAEMDVTYSTASEQWLDNWISTKYDALRSNCLALKATCMSTPCDRYEAQMLQDVSPGGQYALFSFEPFTVLEANINVLYNNWRLVFPVLTAGPIYDAEAFYLNSGEKTSPHDPAFTLEMLVTYWKPEWAKKFIAYHPEKCKLEYCNTNSQYIMWDEQVKTLYNKASDIASIPNASGLQYSTTNSAWLLANDPFFQTGKPGAIYFSNMQNDLNQYSVSSLNMTAVGMNVKGVSQFVDYMLYCSDPGGSTNTSVVSNNWNNCTPNPLCRVPDREWQQYRDIYFQIKEKYYLLSRNGTSCAGMCQVGTPASYSACAKPSDFSITKVDEPVCAASMQRIKIAFEKGASVTSMAVAIYFPAEYAGAGIPSSFTFNVGQKEQTVCIPANVNVNTLKVKSVTCDSLFSEPACPFGTGGTLTLPANATQVAGNVFQSINAGNTKVTTYSIISGQADQTPADATYCAGGTVLSKQFYNCLRVSIPGTVVPARFFNVWVVTCEKNISNPNGRMALRSNSTIANASMLADDCPGVALFNIDLAPEPSCEGGVNGLRFVVSTTGNIPLCAGQSASIQVKIMDMNGEVHVVAAVGFGPGESQKEICIPQMYTEIAVYYYTCGTITGSCAQPCPDDYKYKVSRFPENNYNTSPFTNTQLAQQQAENFAMLSEQIKTSCESMADTWMAKMESCLTGYTETIKSNLRAALIDVCKRGGDLDHPYGASTTRPGDANPSSFKQAIKSVLGISVLTMACNPWLIDEPHPYTPMQQSVTKELDATNADICARLQELRTQHTTENASITFFQFLTNKFGEAMNLTQSQLDKLIKSCDNCRFLLEETIPLPVFMEPRATGCITLTEYNAAKADLVNEFGANWSSSDVNYPTVLANYMNHRFGFTMASYRYDDFETVGLGNSSAILCNQPPYTTMEQDLYLCLRSQIASAIISGRKDYIAYIEEKKREFRVNYVETCSLVKGNAFASAKQQVYHYTLYYYDQAGNLLRTVSPAGVRVLSLAEAEIVKAWREFEPSSCTGVGIPSVSNKAATWAAFSASLTSGSIKSLEMWMYSGLNDGNRQVRIMSYDNKYFLHTTITDNKLWINLYSLSPTQTLLNAAVADISTINLQSWSHLIVSSSNFASGTWTVYLDGKKLTLITSGQPVNPYAWTPGNPLQIENIAQVKHFRIYNSQPSDAEVFENYQNSCMVPQGNYATALTHWGRLNIPSLCNAATETRMVPNQGAIQVVNNLNITTPKLASVANTFTVEMLVRPFYSHEIDVESNTGIQGVYNQHYALFPPSGGSDGTAGMGISVGINGVSVYEHADEYMAPLLVWPVTINKWTHIAVVYQNKVPTLYIDGKFAKTGLPSLKTTVSPGVNIASGPYGVMEGGIDEFRIWNYARSEDDIDKYHNASVPVSNALVVYYPFNKQDGNVLSDISCSKSNLEPEASGFAWMNELKDLKDIVPVEYAIRNYYPGHKLLTSYAYNSTGQVIQQKSPDGGTSYFWYDQLSRLIASQNAEQRLTNKYSYTQYEPTLSRIIEVGEKASPTVSLGNPGFISNPLVIAPFLQYGTNSQITQTLYDIKPNGLNGSQGALPQENLRKRVSASFYKATATGPVLNATYYDYDLVGNVKTLWQQIDGLGLKRIDYVFDLISGKVNQVRYQAQQNDQFYYDYSYDAENRLLQAATSVTLLPSGDLTDKETDATYKYYLHGPVARMELGNATVQGLDYAYTLQGWLKGVNGNKINTADRIGNDGIVGSAIAKDVFGFSLGYYNGDYKPIGSDANAFRFNYQYQSTELTGNNLYNGNISNSTLAISRFRNGEPVGYTYGYDQLHRLVKMRHHTLTNSTVTWNSGSIVTAYQEDVSYDANGNISKYKRNGANAGGLNEAMDDLTYKYNEATDPVTGVQYLVNNRLKYVDDAVPTGSYAKEDIDDQSEGYYEYDNIGNLKKDGDNTIKWNVYGKISEVIRSGSNITYTYDGAGNRVKKVVTVLPIGEQTESTTTTWYVRDATSNVLAVYSQKSGDVLKWKEQHLYGISRLGMWEPDISIATVNSGSEWGIVGKKSYELTNHLGNVLAVITDKKITLADGSFDADVVTANDYYPFGMLMPGRSITAPGCQEVIEDLTDVKASSDLNSGATKSGNNYIHNGVTYQPQGNNTLSVANGAITVLNGGQASSGILVMVPIANVQANTVYMVECDMVDYSPAITYFNVQAITQTNDTYRVSVRKSGTGRYSIIFKTGASVGGFMAFRITPSSQTAGLYFTIDNFVCKKLKQVNEPDLYVTTFNDAQMDGVNVNVGDQVWKPFNASNSGLSVTGTTDKKIQVNCTNVVDARVYTDLSMPVPGGRNYMVKMTTAQSMADKRLFIQLYYRTGTTGSWTSLSSGIFFVGSGTNQFNFTMPEGADQLRVEFLRNSTGASYDGLDIPYTIDNLSLTQIDPVFTRTTTVCAPNADPSGENGIYRYGFNGQEISNEINGDGNSYTAEYWEYDPRLGRRWNNDPKPNPSFSYYSCFENNPIWKRDKYGDTLQVVSAARDANGVDFEKGGNRSNPMLLFKADDGLKTMLRIDSKEFNKKYQTVSVNTRYTVNGIDKTKKYVKIIEGSYNINYLVEKGMLVRVTIQQLNNEITRITRELNNSASLKSTGWGDWTKWHNFDHGEQGDIKAEGKLLNGNIFTYIEGVGIATSDFIGNVVYGYVASAHQTLNLTFNDGDRLQKGGVDDPFDSYALMLGDIAGRRNRGLGKQSFRTDLYLLKQVKPGSKVKQSIEYTINR